MKITGLPPAASMAARTLVATSERRASTPSSGVSRCPKARYGPRRCITGSQGSTRSPSSRVSTSTSVWECPVATCVWRRRTASYSPAATPVSFANTCTVTRGSHPAWARVLTVRRK